VTQAEELKAIIEAIPGKTLAAKLRRVMPEIDRRVREGVMHEEIVQALNEHGFDLNLNTFRSYLYRYRRKLKEAAESPTPAKAPGVAPVSPPATDSPVGKPAESIRPITNKGELAKVRNADFDLDQLAELGKTKE
jgi:hypothetical protein